MIVNFTFIGLMAPVFTIFNQDFSVNTDKIPSYANYLLDSGIKGILVGASSGEGTSLSVQERKILTEAWTSAVRNTSQHLMVQVGGAPFPDVVDLARHADTLGVDSILTLPELYFKPTKSQELISYLKFISAAAPNTPLLYYHHPSLSGVNIDMAEFLNEASHQVPNLKGVKYASNDLAVAHAALRAANGKYRIFIGSDHVIEPAFSVGFDSAIVASSNAFPRYSKEILQAVKDKQLERAIDLQQNLTKIMTTVTKFGSKVPGMKLAMNLFTPINVGLARPPLQNLNPHRIGEFRSTLEPLL
ncbi:N-acetylneuraminate lyase-like isoform X1 [Euwallacea fornicatus]|uniref:N-acetylneuraminate lyase-like isoform X1 n=1 Tax=Euwallacea fornicatus TaxID=995702 RepID=UPI00338F485D